MSALGPPPPWWAQMAREEIAKALGERLPAIPNPWASTGIPLRPEPSTVPEPTYFLAARILGDDECQRLMEAADV